ncbi:MAG: 2-phosphosulfolactate phosphatase [Planctomycetia bacterium]|nr:2-phosphosulfolactate phosphatase [Planctomycetia bacterium]
MDSIYLSVFPLPELMPETDAFDLSLCIDVLRATTTITTALHHGARSVRPFLSVEEALKAKAIFLQENPEKKDRLVLGGERKGIRIESFDLANSPDEYTRAKIAGKIVYFTTTNGTKAILRGQGTVVPVSFVNAGAVVEKVLGGSYQKIAIICAGTCGNYTEEDLLLAGCLVSRIEEEYRKIGKPLGFCKKNLQACAVEENWRLLMEKAVSHNPSGQYDKNDIIAELAKILPESRGGKNLCAINLKKDILDAAQIDSIPIVPIYKDGAIVIESL